ncbi:MAG: CPBP family intramembrane glutamic endopeptidase [Candidatus Thorarchaeota archaeon]
MFNINKEKVYLKDKSTKIKLARDIKMEPEEIEIDLKKKHMLTWSAIIVILASYVVFLIVPNYLLNKFAPENFQTYLDNNPYLSFIVNFLAMGILLVVLLPFLLDILDGRKSYKQFLKNMRITKIKPILRILGLGILSAVIILALARFATYLGTIKQGFYLFDISKILGKESSLYTSLFPGIWEEVAFRGIILALLLKIYTEKKSIIVNGFLFGFFHLVNLLNFLFGVEYSLTTLVSILFQVVYATAIGFFYAYLFVKTKSLIPSIISHYLVDALIILVSNVGNVNPFLFLAIMAIVGIGILPSIINIVFVYFVYRKFPEKEDEYPQLQPEDEIEVQKEEEFSLDLNSSKEEI